jgi:hypothetical protein
VIITQNSLLAVGGCPVIVQHLVDTGYEGLTRLQFVQKLQQDADAGLHPQWWVTWGKVYLYNGDAISKLGYFTRTQKYRVEGMNIVEDMRIFTDVQDAIAAIQTKQAEQVASESWVFHVHAKCPAGEDAHTLHNCDLDGDGVLDHPIDCYQTFNNTTGQYEFFDTFAAAKLRCDELRAARFTIVHDSYRIIEEVQQINDPEENPSGWTLCNVGDALKWTPNL